MFVGVCVGVGGGGGAALGGWIARAKNKKYGTYKV